MSVRLERRGLIAGKVQIFGIIVAGAVIFGSWGVSQVAYGRRLQAESKKMNTSER